MGAGCCCGWRRAMSKSHHCGKTLFAIVPSVVPASIGGRIRSAALEAGREG